MIWVRVFSFTTCLAILILPLGSISHSKTAAERRAELAKISELMAHPDPLMRVAHLEEIIGEGDALKIELAIQTALTIDDHRLRAQAMKAYLIRTRDVTFDWLLPKDVKAAKQQQDKNALRPFTNFLTVHNNSGGSMPFRFENIETTSGSFRVYAMYAQAQPSEKFSATGKVLGDRLNFRLLVPFGAGGAKNCTVDVRPTSEFVLKGRMRCEKFFYGGEMPLEAQMF